MMELRLAVVIIWTATVCGCSASADSLPVPERSDQTASGRRRSDDHRSDTPPVRKRSDPPVIRSSWDDLLEGVETAEDWRKHRQVLRTRFLELIRDDQKPPKPPLKLEQHESVVVDGVYTRRLISYTVEADERAHAYLGVPLKVEGKAPGIVALHGTYPKRKERVAGLVDNPDKAYLDHLCRRGYVVIAPDHFVAHESRQLIYAWMDTHLKPSSATQTRLVVGRN